jgi:hypothetical protein
MNDAQKQREDLVARLEKEKEDAAEEKDQQMQVLKYGQAGLTQDQMDVFDAMQVQKDN